MAKAKQRLKSKKRGTNVSEVKVAGPIGSAAPLSLPLWVVWCRRLAVGLLGSLLVYVAYFPSDSIQVEGGDALWFCVLSLILWTMTMATEPLLRAAGISDENGPQFGSTGTLLGNGLVLDLSVWSLAVWMMVAALATCPPGNLRLATNEAWLWIAGAAVLTASRRLLVESSTRAVVLSLMAAVAVGMSMHALHQNWISLPQMRADYLADPDQMLRDAGMVAPPGSARRMVFANRLFDGGPTATFALANSLAAVLVIGVLVPIGVLRARRRFSQAPAAHRVLLINFSLVLVALVAAMALFATRSRSAIAACVLAAVWLWFSGIGTVEAKRRTRVTVAFLVAACVAATILVGLLVFGDEEWMSAAPASLEFRLQYWKSTTQMLFEHPLFGAGPGGFQSLYLMYRLPVANETISDPHNFFFETLAAGGFVGGLLFSLAVVACIKTRSHIDSDEGDEGSDDGGHPGGSQTWMVYGAGATLALVWLFGLASGQLPDFQASVFSVPAAIAAGWLIHRQMREVPGVELRRISTAILLAIMVHLLVSGGWTVPGVAIMIWLVVAMICSSSPTQSFEPEPSVVTDPVIAIQSIRAVASKTALAAFGLGIAMLVCLRFISIVPVQTASVALMRSEDAMRRGMQVKADMESRQALEADRWGFEAARWRSEMLRSQLISSRNDAVIRRQWIAAVEMVVQRAGDNPLILRAVGEQCLHAYQVFGQENDLELADQLISQALTANPTDLSLVGQASMIALERDQVWKARELALETHRLSELGNNIVRDLGLQQVLVVAKIGRSAANAPKMSPIKDQFRDRLGWEGEPAIEPERSIETEKG